MWSCADTLAPHIPANQYYPGFHAMWCSSFLSCPPCFLSWKMVAVEMGVQCGIFLRTQGSVVLSCHLKVSRARVNDSTGTSNRCYFLIMLDLMLNPRHFVSGFQVKSGTCILLVVLEEWLNLHILWRGSSARLWVSYRVSGETPLQLSLSSEKIQRKLEDFLLICTSKWLL